MAAVIEITGRGNEITQRQRYSHYFAIVFGLLGLLIGVNLRDSTMSATALYTDTRAGVRAFYPQNWLIDTNSAQYVFRAQDVSQPGYKTTLQVSMYPVSPQTTIRNVIEALTLSRSQTLAQYSVFAADPYVLQDQPEATLVEYAFAAGDSDPFLESLPAVVHGMDIITIKRGQAIIVTFWSDAEQFGRNLPVFQQFVSDLEF